MQAFRRIPLEEVETFLAEGKQMSHLRWVSLAIMMTGLATPPSFAAVPSPQFSRMQERASTGDAEAQYQLGLYLLELHEGTPPNPKEAVRWLATAAKQGHSWAMMRVYNMPESLLQVTGWNQQQWLQWAADHGEKGALCQLAIRALEAGKDDPAAREAALKRIEALAKEGEGDAALQVSSMYSYGTFGEKDPVEAQRWLQLAAEGGSEHAKDYIASQWFTGRDGKTRRDEAIALFRKLKQPSQEVSRLLAFVDEERSSATEPFEVTLQTVTQRAENGDLKAIKRLANFYAAGGGSMQSSDTRRLHFLRLASDRGDIDSTLAGLACASGINSGSKDAKAIERRATALAESGNTSVQFALWERHSFRPGQRGNDAKWLKVAADHGHGLAAIELARDFIYDTDGRRDLKQGLHYAQLAIKADYAVGYFYVAEYYANGWLVPRDLPKAVENYRLAVAKGCGDEAELTLAKLLGQHGTPVYRPDEALRIYRKLAEDRHHGGMVGLGHCYETSCGVPVDLKEAVNWYEAVLGELEDTALMDEAQQLANFYLGRMYELGHGKPKDLAKARFHYQQSGTVDAIEHLAELYERGIGGPKDEQKAYMAYSQAAAMGSEQAKSRALQLRTRLNTYEIQQADRERSHWYEFLKDEDE